mgnify:CR=1 FL=1
MMMKGKQNAMVIFIEFEVYETETIYCIEYINPRNPLRGN